MEESYSLDAFAYEYPDPEYATCSTSEVTTYRYPDPRGTAYPFALSGEDDAYVPAALQNQPAGSWETDAAEPDCVGNASIGEPSSRDHDHLGGLRNDTKVDSDYQAPEHEEFEEAIVSDDEAMDYQTPATRSRRRGGVAQDRTERVSFRGFRGRGRRGRRGGLGRGGKGVKRGLRNPIEPEPEFKVLHSQATMAFIDNDYDRAEQLTLEALLINPEMYSAHSLLSEIHAARGDTDKALTAAWNGAHTRPRDTQMWLRIARLILERDAEPRTSTLRDAIYCYTRIIAVDKSNVEARYERAALNRELQNPKKVASEYEQLAKYLPHDTTVLRHLAEAYIDLDEPDRAIKHYEASISHFLATEPIHPTTFTWSDVNIVGELCSFQKNHQQGLTLTKSLSRWLLGRREEHCWQNFNEDDREWDASDEPRRIEVPGFVPDSFEAACYGDGLPLELRIKLGLFRLQSEELGEAMIHFEWLDQEDSQIGAKLFDYPDLFRAVAKSLAEQRLYEEALRFYEPLQQVVDYVDRTYLFELAHCYNMMGLYVEAEECYRSLLDRDDSDSEARIKLMQIRRETGAWEDEIDGFNSVPHKDQTFTLQDDKNDSQTDETATAAGELTNAMLAPRPPPKRPKKAPVEKETKEDDLEALFAQWQSVTIALKQDEPSSKRAWMTTAQRLVKSFMDEKAFYPQQRHNEFMGYSQEARHLSRRKIHEKASTMDSQTDVDGEPVVVPDEYGGVSFKDWLDIFLEYALSLAHIGDRKQAYDIMTAATQANVFYHSPESLFLIYVCWFTCALLESDDETLCNTSRWFMREYQFTTDGYCLFSAMNRLTDSDHTWFNCGPSQKYILRQVKAVDFSLLGDARGRSLFQERASYTTKDDQGKSVLAQNMDAALLMLYGHILYAGKSYAYAINYFLRALSVDPDNTTVKFSLALGYIHHALKRQADNRHQLLMQGFAFLMEYYDDQQEKGGCSEKQEAACNVARAYHMLGLTHLAIPYYEQCLNLSNAVQEKYNGTGVEDFAQEAAFALQGIWAAGGNEQRARLVTERWLQL